MKWKLALLIATVFCATTFFSASGLAWGHTQAKHGSVHAHAKHRHAHAHIGAKHHASTGGQQKASLGFNWNNNIP